MGVYRESTDPVGVGVVVDGEATTMTTTTTLLHHTTPITLPTPTIQNLDTGLIKAGVLASGLALQVVPRLDGLQANLPTEETGAIKPLAGGMETAVEVAGTMAEKVTREVHPGTASPAQDMRVLGSAVLRDDDRIVVLDKRECSCWLRMIPLVLQSTNKSCPLSFTVFVFL